MPDLWDDLLSCLTLDVEAPLGDDGTAVYLGRNQALGYYRVFGGQLLGQFIEAARLAVPSKTVKSVTTLFPSAGDPAEPIRYEVRREAESRSFATVTITARQPAGVIATAAVSLHATEEGPDHQVPLKAGTVPGPEHVVDHGPIPWEVRSTDELDTPEALTPEADLWMRTPPAGPELAPALIAYGTDLTIIGTGLRMVEGISQKDAQKAFKSAVTSHSVWFHRPFRTDSWWLLRQQTPILAHGRGFGRGDVLAEDGSLVASFAQESLVRFSS